MSAFEFALTPPSHFISTVLPVPVESPRSAVEALASRYEEVARLSQATASIKIENLPHRLIALLRPNIPLRFLGRGDLQSSKGWECLR